MIALWNPTPESCVDDGLNEVLCRQSLDQDVWPTGEHEQVLDSLNTNAMHRSNQLRDRQYLNLYLATS